jgi:glycosyltransferase involved in cell wall biosynthesis
MPVFPVTAHMIVRNEDRFVWHAINSVLPLVKQMLIYDTGSTDDTVRIMENLAKKNKKIKFRKFNIKSPTEVGQLRIKQVKETKTPWFLIVDGDEIWPEKQLKKLLGLSAPGKLPKKIIGVVNPFRDAVGDIWHYQSDSGGRYSLLGRIGHYTIRLMRTLDYEIGGDYPNEGYYLDGRLINEQDDLLVFCATWYLHTTHLRRSSRGKDYGRRKKVVETGIEFKKNELPETLFEEREGKIDVLVRRGIEYEIMARLITPLKKVKRKVMRS